MVQAKRVVLVGHCGPDSWALRHAVSVALPGVAVEQVNTDAELSGRAGPDALLLVNRVLDGQFAVGMGVELIRSLAGRPDRPRMILISNYSDAQAQAQAAGALPGFGKAELDSDETIRRLRLAADNE